MTAEPPRTPRPPAQSAPAGPAPQGESPSGRFGRGTRAILATIASLILPGLGHLLFGLGRRRVALVFLVPAVLGALVAGVWALTQGTFGVLAFLVAPGVLTAVFGLNVLVGAWRAVAALDVLRRTRPGLAAGGVSLLLLLGGIAFPHVLAGWEIQAANDLSRRDVREHRCHPRAHRGRHRRAHAERDARGHLRHRHAE
jgi:hypothetical protein